MSKSKKSSRGEVQVTIGVRPKRKALRQQKHDQAAIDRSVTKGDVLRIAGLVADGVRRQQEQEDEEWEDKVGLCMQPMALEQAVIYCRLALCAATKEDAYLMLRQADYYLTEAWEWSEIHEAINELERLGVLSESYDGEAGQNVCVAQHRIEEAVQRTRREQRKLCQAVRTGH